MNIEKVKHEVLNNNLAIEYDNGDLEKLRKVLKFIFPDDESMTKGIALYYFRNEIDSTIWNVRNYFEGKSIPLSKIKFDKPNPTLNDVIELRKKFPNDWDFAQKFDELKIPYICIGG